MEFKDVIEKRTSVRTFINEAVKIEDLREIVRLAGLAPSVNNSQPWRFIAITNKNLLRKMEELVHKKINELLHDTQNVEEQKVKSKVLWHSTFFVNAPSVIAVVVKPYDAIIDKLMHRTDLTHEEINNFRGSPDIMSIGASIENLILGAVDLGYGACWLSGPMVARESLEECLGIKSPWRLSSMIAIGKPSVNTDKSEKKSLDEIFEIRS
jgi:nitroreductase